MLHAYATALNALSYWLSHWLTFFTVIARGVGLPSEQVLEEPPCPPTAVAPLVPRGRIVVAPVPWLAGIGASIPSRSKIPLNAEFPIVETMRAQFTVRGEVG